MSVNSYSGAVRAFFKLIINAINSGRIKLDNTTITDVTNTYRPIVNVHIIQVQRKRRKNRWFTCYIELQNDHLTWN
jgi:hypothetical protein